MSQEEMRTNPVGFWMDTSDSWHFNYGSSPVAANRTKDNPYNSDDSKCGNGIINNVKAESVNGAVRYNIGSTSNAGLLNRIKEQNFSTVITATNPTVWPSNAGAIRNMTSIQNELKSYTVVNQVANDTAYQAFYYVAIIKLKDLTDIFY